MKKPFKLVYVEWEDSFGCSAFWCNLLEAAAPRDIEPQLAKSVGWIVRESTSGITVVPHLADETKQAKAQGCGDMTIPRSAIRKMVLLDITDNRVEARRRPCPA